MLIIYSKQMIVQPSLEIIFKSLLDSSKWNKANSLLNDLEVRHNSVYTKACEDVTRLIGVFSFWALEMMKSC